jgi:hypothetical protein
MYVVLVGHCFRRSKEIAERRIVLAGYRLAELMKDTVK